MFSASKIIISDSITKGGISKSLPDSRLLNINPSAISPATLQKAKEQAAGNNAQGQVQMNHNLTYLLDELHRRADSAASFALNPKYKYKSIEKLILQFGQAHVIKAKNSRFKGSPKICYKNCYEVMKKHPDLTYCEGYAFDNAVPFVFNHAWLINAQGEVIDPTWRDADSKNAAYFGVAFKRDYVINFVKTYQEYGILEGDYQQGHKFKIEGFPTDALA